ncbi:MAG: transketolase [Spirochaetales bacterium]|nr:transketolase [Spirochaetales bacterium]
MKLGPSTAPMIPPPFQGVPNINNPEYTTGAGYNGPCTPDYDRFFLSPAHYALVLYTVLIETGRMAPEGLTQFNQDGSTVEMIGAEHSPGFEMMGGSLAQTLSQAGGIALARILRNQKGRIWVFMSDGEFQEGQVWEAFQTLAHYGIDNLSVFVDVNGQQCDGEVKNVMGIEPLEQRLRAFGAFVLKADGHDPDALCTAAAADHADRPLVVLCYTDSCRGVPLLEQRRPLLHYVRFKNEAERREYATFLQKHMPDQQTP